MSGENLSAEKPSRGNPPGESPEPRRRSAAGPLLKVAFGLLLLLNGGFVLIYFLGSRLPVEHQVVLERRLEAPVDEVWARVRDLGASADWRSDVAAMRRLEEAEGEVWEATTSFGPVRFAVEVDEAPHRLVTRIVDNEDFGGTWTYVLEPADGHTQLRLTEDGEVHGNMMRFFAHYLFGYDATARLHLDDLERETEGGAPAETDAPAGG